MSYPISPHLNLPLTPYNLGGYTFGQRLRRRVILWATHLGDDLLAPPGTPVRAIGTGKVVYAKTHPGSVEHRSWGGLVVLGHTQPDQATSFFSLYGHLDHLTAVPGQVVLASHILGQVAAGLSAENGWWEIPHLHFAIYTGPWLNQVLPGYKRPEQFRTRRRWWQDPRAFIEQYNLAGQHQP